jgi:hypothetical protein
MTGPTVAGRICATVLLVVVLGVSSAVAAGVRYQAPDGSWELSYPQGWEVVASRDGRAVAFVAPAVAVGQARLRPSLVVSALAVPAGLAEAAVKQVATQAVTQGMPGAVLLGEETITAADGGVVWIRYYAVPAQQAPPLYLVVGIAMRGRLYVLLGSTSSALPDYRQQAAVFRASMASFRGR